MNNVLCKVSAYWSRSYSFCTNNSVPSMRPVIRITPFCSLTFCHLFTQLQQFVDCLLRMHVYLSQKMVYDIILRTILSQLYLFNKELNFIRFITQLPISLHNQFSIWATKALSVFADCIDYWLYPLFFLKGKRVNWLEFVNIT